MSDEKPPFDLAANGSIRTRDALIVEDNIIIAMAAEDILSEIGFTNCTIVASNREARRAIEERDIGFAMLDINLGEETSELTARLLHERGIPYVFATGYGESPLDSGLFGSVPTLTKPYSERDLLAVIATLTVS
jgi:CheY-like chemotaxis protein